MASIPGFCRHCGAIIPNNNFINVVGGGQASIHNVVMTCPRCGRDANLLEGTFTDRGYGLEMLSGPLLSKLVVSQLREISRRAKSHEITPEQAVEEAARIDPKLGKLIERFVNMGVPLLALVVSIIALYLQYQGNISTSEFEAKVIEQLERQTRAVETTASIEKDQRHQRVDGKGDRPTKAKADKKSAAEKGKSNRRAEVNKTRRAEIKRRRMAFSPVSHRRKP